MTSFTAELWNEIWSGSDHNRAGHDGLLVECAGDLEPGLALDLGCGLGGNAVWLAARGWRVTAVDFSHVAIGKARALASDCGVEVEFLISDAATYRPSGSYDLIMAFYIQLAPRQRARMLAYAATALAPGGRVLFINHDQSGPPPGWTQEELETLTTPSEVATELPGLRIKRAEVLEEASHQVGHAPRSVESRESDQGEHHHCSGDEPENNSQFPRNTTLVVAEKDK